MLAAEHERIGGGSNEPVLDQRSMGSLRPGSRRGRGHLMICRIWHGWTTPADADAYERLLRMEVFHGIAQRRIAGYHGIDLLRRLSSGEVEFVTLMWFESLDAVQAFAGPDYEMAVVPPAARALLARFDERAVHYEVRQPDGAA